MERSSKKGGLADTSRSFVEGWRLTSRSGRSRRNFRRRLRLLSEFSGLSRRARWEVNHPSRYHSGNRLISAALCLSKISKRLSNRISFLHNSRASKELSCLGYCIIAYRYADSRLGNPMISGLAAHAMKECSMKRKSTICAMQSSRGFERTRTHAQ